MPWFNLCEDLRAHPSDKRSVVILNTSDYGTFHLPLLFHPTPAWQFCVILGSTSNEQANLIFLPLCILSNSVDTHVPRHMSLVFWIKSLDNIHHHRPSSIISFSLSLPLILLIFPAIMMSFFLLYDQRTLSPSYSCIECCTFIHLLSCYLIC